MTERELEAHLFERTVSGAEYGIAVDFKLTFFTVSGAGTNGTYITPFGGINDETGILVAEIEGDIMPVGFEHGPHFDAKRNVPTDSYMQVLRTMSDFEQKIGLTYLEVNSSWSTEALPYTPTRSFNLVQNQDVVTSEFASVQVVYTGKPNGHPHWSGNHIG